MEENRQGAEKLKDNIFNIFSKYQSESASDRRQVYIGLFNDLLKKWCKYKLRYKNVEDMGSEIYGVTWRVIQKDKLLNNKDGFFRYISKSLKNAKNEYYRKLAKIRIPRELFKLKTFEEVILMKEKQLGRSLTIKEHNKYILIWKNIENIRNVKSLSYDVSDEKYSNKSYEENILDEKTEKIIEAINFFFEKRNKKPELVACYKALYTVDCIRKKIYINDLRNILDHEIIEKWQKDGLKPELYAIYKKYRPKVTKGSAGARSTTIINEINKELNKYLVKNYPQIFPKNP